MPTDHDPPVPADRKPCWPLPEGATDSHFHVFGPEPRYPYDPTRDYTPGDALPSQAARLFAGAGIRRAVLVQPSPYGQDNRRHLDAAAELGIDARVVVSAAPDADLDAMERRGACAMRLTTLRTQLSPREIIALSQRLGARGWHLQILPHAGQLADLAAMADYLGCDLVIDHMGMIDPSQGTDQAAVEHLVRLMGSGRRWVKLSGYARLSRKGPPYDDVTPVVQALVQAAPSRLLWGSDWPHAAFSGPIPDYADLLDPLARWLPDDATRRAVLVDNPARLFGFAALTPETVQDA